MKCPYCGDDHSYGGSLVGHIRHNNCTSNVRPANYSAFSCPFCGKIINEGCFTEKQTDYYREHILECGACIAAMLTGKPVIEVQ